MKGIIALCLFTYLSIAASNASAEWAKEEIKDAMRGTSTSNYRAEAVPIYGQGPKVFLKIMQDPNGEIGALFSVEKDKFARCDSTLCDIEFRFDNSAVHKALFVSKDDTYRVPVDAASFAGAVKLSNELYIEFDFGRIGKRQYKFMVGGLPIEAKRTPVISISGYELGKRYASDEISLKKYKDQNGTSCYSGGDQEKPFGVQKVSRVSLCFSSGYLNAALITPGSKAAYAEGVSYLSNSFGSMDRSSGMPRWPKSSGKMLNMNTISASYFSTSRNDYSASFIITDGVADLLAQ